MTTRPPGRAGRGRGGDCGDGKNAAELGWNAPSPVRPALRAGLPKCGDSRTETPEQEGVGSGDLTPSRSWLGLPKCGDSRTETPEQEGVGSGDLTPSRSWLGLPKCGDSRTETPE